MGEYGSSSIFESDYVNPSPVFDTTPEIHYKGDIAVNVRQYCITNGQFLAQSDYGISGRGFTESHFDEYLGCLDREPRIISRSRLEEFDTRNPKHISLVKVLGASREEVEKYLQEKRLEAKHVNLK